MSETPPPDRDQILNAETRRAFRRDATDLSRLLAASAVVLPAMYLAILIGLFEFSLLMSGLLIALLSVVTSVVLIRVCHAVGLDLSPIAAVGRSLRITLRLQR